MFPEPQDEQVAAVNYPSRKAVLTVELMLFLGLWLFYGTLINVKNIDDFGQSVTEAIVDQHRFSVEGLTAWPVKGDVFGFQGHTYSNKNPGQAIISSVAYAHLRMLGISYADNKFLVGALVIFFSSSLFAALGSVALFRLAKDLFGTDNVWPLAGTLVWSVGTTGTVFSGVAWHDVLATAMLVIAVYLLHRIRCGSPAFEQARNFSILAGFLLGVIVTTSMTFFFIVVLFGIYFLSLGKRKLILPFIISGVVGVAPLFFYNTVNFGDPLMFPAVAYFKYSGMAPDVYFFLDWNNFKNKAVGYYNLINWYTPILWPGVVGLILLPSRVRREQLFIFGAIVVLVFYMFNVQGFGVCGYGPRYLMPIMPFCALGIAGFGRIPLKILRWPLAVGIGLVALYSVRVNVVGALGGAMYCNYAGFGYYEYIGSLAVGQISPFPLLKFLLPLFLIWCVVALYLILPEEKKIA
ncbi:MAG: hypothetical protein ABL999_17460 [Pyrinomonadaceae bacterium]